MVSKGATLPVPISCIFSSMWLRPKGNEMMTFTDQPVTYQSLRLKQGESKSMSLTCNSVIEEWRNLR